jgi:anti-anti-sigma factor
MEIKEWVEGAVTIVAPSAALTRDNARDLTECFEAAAARSLGRVVIDCTSISHVDSAGLEALVSASEHLDENGGVLRLVGVNATLREVLDITNAGGLFEYYADTASASRGAA